MTAASRLDDLDRDGEQLRDQGQPEGQVGLPLGRAPAGSLEREVMRRERARGLGHGAEVPGRDRKSTRLNSSHVAISYAVFCLKKKNIDDAQLAPRQARE